MTVSNLGVCFGPTLLRPEEETVASIMDLKFYNVVVEILITHYDKIFNTEPEKVPFEKVNNLSEKMSPHTSGYVMVNDSGHVSPAEHLNNIHYLGPEGQDIYGNVRNHNSNSIHPSVRQNINYTQQPYTCVSIKYIKSKIIILLCCFFFVLDC